MIENEVKFVIRNEIGADYFIEHCGQGVPIHQGYLPGKARIRSKSFEGGLKFFFTYKLPVKDVVFEIEKEITEHEFDVLWPHTTDRLNKLRFMLEVGDVHWDIDLFYDNDGDRYFSLAEAEMPEDMLYPADIPAFLKETIRYAVPRNKTKDYSSKNLSSPKYAKELLSKLK